jgi:hypothetical protein
VPRGRGGRRGGRLLQGTGARSAGHVPHRAVRILEDRHTERLQPQPDLVDMGHHRHQEPVGALPPQRGEAVL